MIEALMVAPIALSAAGTKVATKQEKSLYAVNSVKKTITVDNSYSDELKDGASYRFITESDEYVKKHKNEKCYVDNDTADFLRQKGYDIYENNGNKYYYCTLGTPKIKSMVYNSEYKQLSDVMSRLYWDCFAASTAEFVASTTMNSWKAYIPFYGAIYIAKTEKEAEELMKGIEPNNMALSYVRSYVERYGTASISQLLYDIFYSGGTVRNLAWCALSGGVDEVYNRIQDLVLFGDYNMCDYFSQFVSASEYNYLAHNVRSNKFGNSVFKDPITNKDIDLIHLFASIDGTFGDTTEWSGLMNLIGRDRFKNLVTWAGDIQSCAASWTEEDINKVSDNFTTILAKASGEDDLIADFDAINISSSYLKNVPIHDAMNSYYNDTKSMRKRVLNFVNNVSGNKGFAEFREKVYYYMGIENTNTIYSPILKDMENKDTTVTHKLLGDASFETRKKVANAFLKYVSQFIEDFPKC